MHHRQCSKHFLEIIQDWHPKLFLQKNLFDQNDHFIFKSMNIKILENFESTQFFHWTLDLVFWSKYLVYIPTKVPKNTRYFNAISQDTKSFQKCSISKNWTAIVLAMAATFSFYMKKKTAIFKCKRPLWAVTLLRTILKVSGYLEVKLYTLPYWMQNLLYRIGELAIKICFWKDLLQFWRQ